MCIGKLIKITLLVFFINLPVLSAQGGGKPSFKAFMDLYQSLQKEGLPSESEWRSLWERMVQEQSKTAKSPLLNFDELQEAEVLVVGTYHFGKEVLSPENQQEIQKIFLSPPANPQYLHFHSPLRVGH